MQDDVADPDVMPLWRAIAARLAQGEDPTRIQRVTVTLSRTGHAMISGWLRADGHKPKLAYTGGPASLSVPKIMRALGVTPDRLPAFVEQLLGEIHNFAAERRRAAQLREDLWTHAGRVLADTPRLLARLRAAGVVDNKVDDTVELINALARARCFLPFRRPVPLPRLALHCAGKPHFFDLNDTGYGSKLVLLVADVLNAPLPDTPAGDRALLARAGIMADRFSQTVLAMNLSAVGDGPIDRALRLAREDHRPIHLTLFDLTVWPPRFDPAEPWIVVENPSVVEEAVIRQTTFPLVCTSGTLTAVDHVVLALANEAGVPLRYNGDLDHHGYAIAAAVVSRYSAGAVHMNPTTQRTAEQAGMLANQPNEVPVLDGPSTIPLAIGNVPGGFSATCTDVPEQHRVVYQEHPTLLDIMLGPDPDDPLRTLKAP